MRTIVTNFDKNVPLCMTDSEESDRHTNGNFLHLDAKSSKEKEEKVPDAISIYAAIDQLHKS